MSKKLSHEVRVNLFVEGKGDQPMATFVVEPDVGTTHPFKAWDMNGPGERENGVCGDNYEDAIRQLIFWAERNPKDVFWV